MMIIMMLVIGNVIMITIVVLMAKNNYDINEAQQ